MIAVLDFGSQYTHLITRRLKELGIHSEIFPHNISKDELPINTKGIILSGGPKGVYEKAPLTINRQILTNGMPVLGICYGYQLIAHSLGGHVIKGKTREYGRKVIEIKSSRLLKGLNNLETVWFSHGDIVTKVPSEFKITAVSGKQIAAYENGLIFGIQFHPEVAHTIHGTKILQNFVKVCKEKLILNTKNQVSQLLINIKTQIANESVLIGVSGGVDSLVAALLLKKAIGNNLYCVFVDTGLMRKNEPEEVLKIYRKLKFRNFKRIDAQKEFLQELKEITDPELKRKKIGHTFIRVFEKASKNLQKEKRIKFLAQGTIYPDRIESAATSTTATKIKSHHNLTLPQKLNFQIIEPLKDFYKDEVRTLGKELGIPNEILGRHPFPGPGLAIRIIGKITKKGIEILQDADYIFIEELKKARLYTKVWQAFAVLLPIRTVGVMGDSRTYEYTISLRAVTSRDGMTADWAKIPNAVLEKISSRIVNEIKGVNRVVYDITQKPPATIEYE